MRQLFDSFNIKLNIQITGNIKKQNIIANLTKPDQDKKMKPENNILKSTLNIAFNIIIPVMILNKLSLPLGAKYALLLALVFPIAYGIHDLVQKKKINFFSLLGILNTSITGGLALNHLGGIWFAFKEGVFPLLIGLFVLGSAFTKKPFIETLFLNPQIFNIELIWQKLKERNQATEFHAHIKKSTIFLSLSFLISSLLNFFIAIYIFKPIDGGLNEESQSTLLNEQIAHMTTYGSLIIMIPSFIILMGIFWYLIHGIQKTTSLKFEELMIAK